MDTGLKDPAQLKNAETWIDSEIQRALDDIKQGPREIDFPTREAFENAVMAVKANPFYDKVKAEIDFAKRQNPGNPAKEEETLRNALINLKKNSVKAMYDGKPRKGFFDIMGEAFGNFNIMRPIGSITEAISTTIKEFALSFGGDMIAPWLKHMKNYYIDGDKESTVEKATAALQNGNAAQGLAGFLGISDPKAQEALAARLVPDILSVPGSAVSGKVYDRGAGVTQVQQAVAAVNKNPAMKALLAKPESQIMLVAKYPKRAMIQDNGTADIIIGHKEADGKFKVDAIFRPIDSAGTLIQLDQAEVAKLAPIALTGGVASVADMQKVADFADKFEANGKLPDPRALVAAATAKGLTDVQVVGNNVEFTVASAGAELEALKKELNTVVPGAFEVEGGKIVVKEANLAKVAEAMAKKPDLAISLQFDKAKAITADFAKDVLALPVDNAKVVENIKANIDLSSAEKILASLNTRIAVMKEMVAAGKDLKKNFEQLERAKPRGVGALPLTDAEVAAAWQKYAAENNLADPKLTLGALKDLNTAVIAKPAPPAPVPHAVTTATKFADLMRGQENVLYSFDAGKINEISEPMRALLKESGLTEAELAGKRIVMVNKGGNIAVYVGVENRDLFKVEKAFKLKDNKFTAATTKLTAASLPITEKGGYERMSNVNQYNEFLADINNLKDAPVKVTAKTVVPVTGKKGNEAKLEMVARLAAMADDVVPADKRAKLTAAINKMDPTKLNDDYAIVKIGEDYALVSGKMKDGKLVPETKAMLNGDAFDAPVPLDPAAIELTARMDSGVDVFTAAADRMTRIFGVPKGASGEPGEVVAPSVPKIPGTELGLT